jgi:predicted GIY-YIG superfamily endonuclease
MKTCIYCHDLVWSTTHGLCDVCMARFSEAKEPPKRAKPRLVVDNTKEMSNADR